MTSVADNTDSECRLQAENTPASNGPNRENLVERASSSCNCQLCADVLTRCLIFCYAVARKELEECLWSWPNSRVLTMSRRRELQLRKVRDDAA
ncbi:hypothetical protein BD410DRAFT_787245, partial [Rickenella mellea]